MDWARLRLSDEGGKLLAAYKRWMVGMIPRDMLVGQSPMRAEHPSFWAVKLPKASCRNVGECGENEVLKPRGTGLGAFGNGSWQQTGDDFRHILPFFRG